MAYRNGDSSNSGCTCKYYFHRCQSGKRAITRFVFDLAKADLAYYYKQCIDEVDEIRRVAWACSSSSIPFLDDGNKYRNAHTTEKRKLSSANKSSVHGKT
jgi:hypothetical protein